MAGLKIKKTPSSSILIQPNDFIFQYCPTMFGMGKKWTGAGVKVGVIGSGVPVHSYFENIAGFETFCERNKNPDDIHGISTLTSGSMCSCNKNGLTGMAPNIKTFYTKAIGDSGDTNVNSIVASILWLVVKDVDIIVIPFGLSEDEPILHEAIKKAISANVCVIAAAGPTQSQLTDVDYPANYPEVVAVAASYKEEKFSLAKSTNNKLLLSLPKKGAPTTYGSDAVAIVKGMAVATGIAAGLAACVIEKNKQHNKSISIKDVYGELLHINNR